MSIYGGPDIVTNGLVLYLDAGDVKSYPGSGNTWYDLSGKNNHGTLYGSPTFNSSNNVLNFSFSASAYATIPDPLQQDNLLQEWTVSAWISTHYHEYQELLGESNFNNGLYITTSSNVSLMFINDGSHVPPGSDEYYMYGGQLSDLGWVSATFRFKNSTGARTIYRNIVNISTSGPNTKYIPRGVASTLNLVRDYFGNGFGSLSNFMMYNRYITDAELAQNYNSLKSRYGL